VTKRGFGGQLLKFQRAGGRREGGGKASRRFLKAEPNKAGRSNSGACTDFAVEDHLKKKKRGKEEGSSTQPVFRSGKKRKKE